LNPSTISARGAVRPSGIPWETHRVSHSAGNGDRLDGAPNSIRESICYVEWTVALRARNFDRAGSGPALGERLCTHLADVRGRTQRKLPVKRIELKPDLAFIPRPRYVTG